MTLELVAWIVGVIGIVAGIVLVAAVAWSLVTGRATPDRSIEKEADDAVGSGKDYPSVSIPDPLYQELQEEANLRDISVNELVYGFLRGQLGYDAGIRDLQTEAHTMAEQMVDIISVRNEESKDDMLNYDPRQAQQEQLRQTESAS